MQKQIIRRNIMLTEKEIVELIKKRDRVNSQIELLGKQNTDTELEMVKAIKELQDSGVNVTMDNLQEMYDKYEIIVKKEYEQLSKAVSNAEEELEGLV